MQSELVPFHGGHIEAVRDESSKVHVVVKRVCEALGVDQAGQLRKLKSSPWATVDMMSTVAEDGKLRETACVDLDTLPMWLATINPRKVTEDTRKLLEAYQREAAAVLRDHFFGRPRDRAEVSQMAAFIGTWGRAIEQQTQALASIGTAVAEPGLPYQQHAWRGQT